MDNSYANTPATATNAPTDPSGQGASGTVECLHIYEMGDGTFQIEESTGQPPQGAESVKSLDELLTKVQDTFKEPDEDDQAMADAKAGYGKPKAMQAPNPGGVFGE